jgi:acetyltransferase-like isoleucine patch superfamily enzyme
MRLGKLIRRFLVPAFLRTVIYAVRYNAYVSPKAEVDLSPSLHLGRGVTISSFAKVKAADGPVTIGANSAIGPGCFLSSGTTGIKIGKDAMIAASVVIVANNHVYARIDLPIRLQGHHSRGIVIEDDVWIGANCTVLDGSWIGSGAIVTAGSVVSGKIPPRAIATGNPARVIFERR